MKEKEQLPGWPRGLSRKLAASYIGVSAGLFDEMVRDGRMPRATHINRRLVWDIRLIDRAFESLSGADESDPYVAAVERALPKERRFGDRLLAGQKAIDEKWCPPEYEKYRGEDWFKTAKFYKEGEWEALIRSRPLGIREKRALEGYFCGKGQSKVEVNGAGPGTIDRLVARGFIEVVAERGEGRMPYYGITPAGEIAWQALSDELTTTRERLA
jgi:predicted DNA-binding transcriptional regulator AlpA